MAINKKKLASNILFYLVLAIIYGIAAFAIITKFSGGALYIGNTRVDVVLTDSMSVRNENHKDFLADTQQIQAFDMIVSDKIDENTELKVKDCVLFKSPNYHNQLVVHRIIDVIQEGTEFKVNNCAKDTFNNEDVLRLDHLHGSITMQALDFLKIQIVAYSPEEYDAYYQLFIGPNVTPVETVTTKLSEGVYKHVITYTRDSKVPFKTTIKCGTDQFEYISSITYESKSKGPLVFDAKELVVDSNNGYRKLFNPYFLYEIRADKSNSADGVFQRSDLTAKVTNIIPKLGHVVHFIQSIPGLITLIGLALIITFGSYFWTKNVKNKKASVETVNNGEVINQNEEAKEIETPKEEDNAPPKEEKIETEDKEKEP